MIPNQQGRLIPRREVVKFKSIPDHPAFTTMQASGRSTITADLAKRNSLTPLQVTNKVVDRFDLRADWPGMRFVVGGEVEETQESMVSLAIAMAATAAVAIYLVLVLLFNSFGTIEEIHPSGSYMLNKSM